jgi:hypothetical protein
VEGSGVGSARTSRLDEKAAAAARRLVAPKVAGIVDQISTLTLLEAADLVDALKSRLNIVDIVRESVRRGRVGSTRRRQRRRGAW